MESLDIKKVNMLYNPEDTPPLGKGLIMSVQHIFAMFGATILVPLILGMPVSVALFCSGVGTLIYQFATKSKVPVYLGSSFAFIAAMQYAIEQMGGDVSAAQTGVILTGLIYVLVALGVKWIGTGWIDRLLPPVVIGPMIIVIGLGLAGTAVSNADFVEGGDWRNMLVATITFLICAFVNTMGKGFIKVVPFLVGIFGGYIVAILVGIVDFTPVMEAPWLQIPEFYLPFETGGVFDSYHFYFGPEALAILPVAIVTISEHIGDHTVLSEIVGRPFLKDPGLHRTLIGDGVATAVSAFLGGPANTTYGENTGVIGMTKIASIKVLRNAAIFAILLSCLGKFTALITTIPNAVLGGMSILLYGVIASNGLKVLIEERINFNRVRNLIIASAMLVLGLGGAVLDLGFATFSGTALAAITGIVLNLILPDNDED
ncbi:uracil-xanthine permease family protein [Aerococcus suis]|uniref:Uracil permease n=1 Tax=Aerococcus suis TaxID=371602 RepID=A0A1W1Z5B2_9LACT|nr:solute carrier family 23 protein [Aerococcus suis]SMC43670.1 uracil permease [Aerococcus suis]